MSVKHTFFASLRSLGKCYLLEIAILPIITLIVATVRELAFGGRCQTTDLAALHCIANACIIELMEPTFTVFEDGLTVNDWFVFDIEVCFLGHNCELLVNITS